MAYDTQTRLGATVYQFRFRGHLGSEWAEWFDGMELTSYDNGETMLSGSVIDQAALHGVLAKIRDLGLTLLAVNCANEDNKGAKSGSGWPANRDESIIRRELR